MPALALAGQAAAQSAATFATKPVTLVVPFIPSSDSDIIARIVAPKLAARRGQAVVVDSTPDTSGNRDAKQLVTAAPDHHEAFSI